MKCIKARYVLSIAATFGMLVCYCSIANLQMSGGTTTETTNGCIIGSLQKINGSPASQTIVKLIKFSYDPVKDGPVPDSLVDTTGEAGEFAFHIAGGGTFNIEGVQRSSGEGILISGVMVKDSDTTTIPPVTIRKPGSIKILLPPNIDTAGAYIYIRGTTICAMLEDTSVFALLDSVPAGKTPDILYAVKSSAVAPQVWVDSAIVPSGGTITIAFTKWVYSRGISLNTTSGGADISSDVPGFPVLVRIDRTNFNFSQAKTDGSDLRFAKYDGSPLPYEIERWDPVAGLAEVWVKVDTIRGNDSSQAITMYWGNPIATSVSNGAAVFDTANGFTAVWHLNTDCSDITTGKHDGTNFGVTDTVGIIGGAKKFDGSSYIQVPGLLGIPQSITLSAWVHLDSTIIFSQDIVSLGDAVALRADRLAAPYYGTQGFFCSKVSASDTAFVFTNTGAFISKTGWRYLTYTVDGAGHVQSMYIDGIFQCSTNDINPINYSGLGPNTFLGTHANKKTQSYAIGCIDEARVCRVARSADWIKLCYMNQKQQDALVRW